FLGCLSQEDLNEMNIELIRNTLYKAYLQDFYRYCQVLGGDTAEVMGEILQVPSHLSACLLASHRRVCSTFFFFFVFLSLSPSSSVRGGQARHQHHHQLLRHGAQEGGEGGALPQLWS